MAYVREDKLIGRLLCGHNDCKHAARVSGSYCCNYIIDTGHSRGCDPTPDCEKYVKGKHEYKNEYTKHIPDYWGHAKDYEV